MSIIASLPPRACAERDAALLDAARAGELDPITWAPVVSERDGHRLVVYVTADALTLERVRFTVTHPTAQRIADLLGAHLLTSRIADLAFAQADVKIAPQIGGHGADMADTARMVAHSRAVDAAAHAAVVGVFAPGEALLLANAGKDWVNTPRLRARPDRAANFGWYAHAAPLRSPGGYPVWQPVGLAHDLGHVDYSQTVRLVRADAELDGVVRPLDELASDPALWRLVSDEGPVELRHPGVPAPAVIDATSAPETAS